MTTTADAMRGWLDRMLSVGYGVVYDYVYPRFKHYQRLQAEVRDLVEAAVPARGVLNEYRRATYHVARI